MSKREQYYTKANSNTLLGVVSTSMSVVLTAAIMPLIVVRFGSDNWARYAFFLLYVSVLAFAESALQMYTMQRTATANATATEYRWEKDRQVRLVFLGLLVLFGIVIGISQTFGLPQDASLQHLLVLAFINVFPRGISAILKGTLLGLSSQMRYYAATTLLNVGRPLFLLLVLLLLHTNIVVLGMLYVIFSMVEMIVYLQLRRSQRSTQQLPSSTQRVDMRLLPSLLMSNVLSVVAVNLDKILVFTSVSLLLASEYTFASSIAGLLYLFVNVAIGSFGPKFKELFLHGELQEMREKLYGISFINNVLVMLAIAAFYFTGDYMLQAMSSSLDRNNVIHTFLLLGTACLLSSNLWIPGMVATSMGQASFSVKTNLLFVVSYLTVFYGVAHESGQSAFAVSMLLAAAMTITVGIVYFKFAILQMSITRYLFVLVILPLVVVGLLIAPLWILDAHFKSVWVNLCYMAVVGAAGIWAWLKSGNLLKLRFQILLVNI